MLPQRIILAIMGFFGVAVYFTMRVSLSIALTEMVKPIETGKLRNDTVVCPAVTLTSEHITVKQNMDKKYSWTQEQQGEKYDYHFHFYFEFSNWL